jgi:hypothetical protein
MRILGEATMVLRFAGHLVFTIGMLLTLDAAAADSGLAVAMRSARRSVARGYRIPMLGVLPK